MRLALMIEGQEGVSWEDWLALARACEEHGVEALFRSDHYLSQTGAEQPALDAWAVIETASAPRRLAAISKLVRVRVDASKKRFTTMRSRSRSYLRKL